MTVRLRLAISAVAALALIPPHALAASPGFAFLSLGGGARAASMGDAQVAVMGDASALHWNPASLTGLDGTEASLTHVEWFQSFRIETAVLSGRFPVARSRYGLLVTGMYAGDQDLVRRDSTGQDIGHFGYFDLAAEGAVSRAFGPTLALGVGAKLVVETIDQVSYGSVAADLGALWRPFQRASGSHGTAP